MYNRKLKAFSNEGLREYRKRRAKMKQQRNWRPILALLAEWLKSKFDTHFDLQGVDTKGNTTVWAPRKYDYYHDGKKLPRRPALIRTGKMRKSMFVKVRGDTLDFGFNRDYWVYHEFGKGRMRRKVFVLTDEYKRVIADSLAWYRITGEAKIIDKGEK